MDDDVGSGAVVVARPSSAQGRDDRDRSDDRTVEPARTTVRLQGWRRIRVPIGTKARSSSDIDTIFRGNLDEAVALLSAAIETGWSGFSGKVIDDGPFEVPGVRVPPRRATAKLTYRGKAFVSVPIEIAAPEGRSIEQIDFVEIKPLHELGLEGPSAVAVLGAPYQIALKLHAWTTVASDGRPNDRGQRFGRRSSGSTRSLWWTSKMPLLVFGPSSSELSERVQTTWSDEG